MLLLSTQIPQLTEPLGENTRSGAQDFLTDTGREGRGRTGGSPQGLPGERVPPGGERSPAPRCRGEAVHTRERFEEQAVPVPWGVPSRC